MNFVIIPEAQIQPPFAALIGCTDPDRMPTDDERTNSLGLFNTAEAYRLSAMALPKIEHRHAEKPRRFLYYHALELYLKALLRQKHSMATVRRLSVGCQGVKR